MEWRMIVCSCAGTTDRDVKRQRDEGCMTLRALAKACGAGAGCGGCAPELRRLLEKKSDAPTVALAWAAK